MIRLILAAFLSVAGVVGALGQGVPGQGMGVPNSAPGLPLSGGTISGQLNIVYPGATSVACPSGSAYICWQTQDSKAFAFISYDQAGNQTRTWDEATGRMDLYGNSASGSTAGSAFVLAYNNATPANGDVAGHYAYRTKDSLSQYNTISYMVATAVNIAATGMSSELQLGVMSNLATGSGNAQPNIFVTIDGSQNTFTLPTSMGFISSGNYASSAGSGPTASYTNTANSRVATVGILDNFNGGINVTGGGSTLIEAGGTTGFTTNGVLNRLALATTIGGTALTLTGSALGLNKMTASGSAPGAAGGKIELVCSATAGEAKLIAYAGTSATPSTILDQIGTGVTGC